MNKKLSITLGLSLLLLGTAPMFAQAEKRIARLSLAPTPLASISGLENTSGVARLQIQQGSVIIVVDLNGATLPEGTVLEGWLVDPGLQGGPGGAAESSESDADELYGTPFGNRHLDALVDRAAYALSTGVLTAVGDGTYVVDFQINNNLTPYNAVVVTLESDSNSGNYDPRPGTPVLAGEL